MLSGLVVRDRRYIRAFFKALMSRRLLESRGPFLSVFPATGPLISNLPLPGFGPDMSSPSWPYPSWSKLFTSRLVVFVWKLRLIWSGFWARFLGLLAIGEERLAKRLMPIDIRPTSSNCRGSCLSFSISLISFRCWRASAPSHSPSKSSSSRFSSVNIWTTNLIPSSGLPKPTKSSDLSTAPVVKGASSITPMFTHTHPVLIPSSAFPLSDEPTLLSNLALLAFLFIFSLSSLRPKSPSA